MADFCRQCAIDHGFFPPDDLAVLTDCKPLPAHGHRGFSGICEGCGFGIFDYIGQCMGKCQGPGLSRQPECPKPKHIFRNFQEAQAFLTEEKAWFDGQDREEMCNDPKWTRKARAYYSERTYS
jgi:hypothetical protein